ncbi:hypothetical protein GCM10018793_35600 [Streptomyces sulfonofaciens]|uniref:N-acetyltransferase domain-containing protein n=2 Tax=Streptomyces sulfonofaciens TaxID=68272 RepID=A0A919G907_9ACTN|nr:hypothetical protein GCM10018793_35600 [Streptomyces sulfonofaciens]
MLDTQNDLLRRIAPRYGVVLENLSAGMDGAHVHRAPNDTVLVYTGLPTPLFNTVVSSLPEPDADEMAEAAAFLAGKGAPWSLVVHGVPDPDTARLAIEHGLTVSVREPLMILPPDAQVPSRPVDHEARIRTLSAPDLDLYVDTLAAGNEEPRLGYTPFAGPFVPRIPGTTLHLAEIDGVAVGTGYLDVSGDIAGIWAITTLPAYRRRGVGRLMTEELVRLAREAGASTVFLYASDMGKPIYASVGFRSEEFLTVLVAP